MSTADWKETSYGQLIVSRNIIKTSFEDVYIKTLTYVERKGSIYFVMLSGGNSISLNWTSSMLFQVIDWWYLSYKLANKIYK